MSVIKGNGAGEVSTGFYPETIGQSYRIQSSNLSRTPSSDGNRRTFTISVWVKRTALGNLDIFATGSNSYNQLSWTLRFSSDDNLYVYASLAGISNDVVIVSKATFRDMTNWYHFVVAYDSTQSTSTNRVKLYANGTQLEIDTGATNHSYGNQNYDTSVNDASYVQRIARFANVDANQFSGYMAEFNLIDGTALDPTYFGETKNGVWIPKKITGLTYGTNGFRLTFADSSSLGDDTSGNGNDYTSSGLASSDVVLDSPTNNFATYNVLTGNTNTTMSEGNLRALGANSSNILESQSSTIGVTSGKWYAEFRADDLVNDSQDNGTQIGVTTVPYNRGSGNQNGYIVGNTRVNLDQSGGAYLGVDQNISTTIGSYADGDIIGVALDVDNSQVSFYKNGSAITNATNASINAQNDFHFFEIQVRKYDGDTSQITANFGQDSTFAGAVSAGGNTDGNGVGDFKYSVPSGYLALCSSNLPDTTLSPNQAEQATDYFNTVTYTGDGNSSNAITGVGFQPDWLWIKERSGTANHGIHDSSRVISGAEEVWYTNATNAANTGGAYISSFDSDGFTLNNNSSGNTNSDTYVAWNWRLNGGTTVSNSNGSITSTTQASTTAGISIVTWTGNFTNGASVGHGLGVVPTLVFIKNRDDNQGSVFNINTTTPYRVNFNSDAGDYGDFAYYNGTYTSDNIVFNNAHSAWNGNTDKMVAYAFHSVEGFSKLGLYIGNGSTDGTFVYTGFRPAWILFKRISDDDSFIIHDNKRDPHNVATNNLFPNGSFAEDSSVSRRATDFLSNGFKIRSSDQFQNYSGHTYFYMAFAEQPFKFSNAR